MSRKRGRVRALQNWNAGIRRANNRKRELSQAHTDEITLSNEDLKAMRLKARAKDTRTAAQVLMGEPPPGRSALDQKVDAREGSCAERDAGTVSGACTRRTPSRAIGERNEQPIHQ